MTKTMNDKVLMAMSAYSTHKPYSIQEWLDARNDSKVQAEVKRIEDAVKRRGTTR